MNAGTLRRSQYQYGSSHWLPDWKRRAVYARDGFRCVRCTRSVQGLAPRDVHLDHLTPRSKGGSHNNDTPLYARNLVTTCAPCNGRRGDKPWKEGLSPEQIRYIESTRRLKLARPMRAMKGR